jgi:hypothetical protein
VQNAKHTNETTRNQITRAKQKPEHEENPLVPETPEKDQPNVGEKASAVP